MIFFEEKILELNIDMRINNVNNIMIYLQKLCFMLKKFLKSLKMLSRVMENFKVFIVNIWK